MKTISSGLDTHLTEEVTTLARCWKITRQDGVQFFFTTHDANLTFEGDEYISMNGFNTTAITSSAALDVDNLNVAGFFEEETITSEDLAAGLFDYADVRLFLVNWSDISQGALKLRRGWFGEVIHTPSGMFKVELRGMTQALAQHIGELYGPECRADLGDTRCKVPIDPDLIQRLTAYEVGDYVKVVTDSGAFGYAQYENRVYKCISAGITADAQPVYDTGVGNTTDDGGAAGGGTVAVYTAPVSNYTLGLFIRIDDFQYTFVTTLTSSSPGNVLIGTTVSDSLDNLFNAITGGPGAGTTYNVDTPVNTTVTATEGAGTITVELADFSIPGQNVLLSASILSGTWDVASLSTSSNACVFQAVEAWSRNFTVTGVTDHDTFAISVDESRAVDGWFDGGVLVFDEGPNHDKGFEVKTWTNSGGAVNLYLPVGFDITIGERGRIYPGCDKSLATCRDKFNNLLNMRAEPYLPGNDAAFTYPDSH